LKYAVTEYCILIPNESWVPAQHRGYGSGRDLGIDPALWIARVIHHDLAVANSVEWCWWLAVSPYEYKDGLVYIDKNKTNGNYYQSKMLWAMGNFSRFVRPGMKRIAIQRSDNAQPRDVVEDLMISSFYNEHNNVIATICVNWSDQDKTLQLNYLNLPADRTVNYVVPYVTAGNDMAVDSLTAYSVLSPGQTILIPARSVVTLVGMHVLAADFEPDGDVDADDSKILFSQWLQAPGNPSADIAPEPNGDGIANLRDFAIFVQHWLEGTTP
jgi:hypothetical protein